jgi:hypothetical protein
MQYPKDFPPESRAAVMAEKLRAGKDFDEARDHLSYGRDVEEQLRKYILRQFLVFVREASKLGKKGIWQVDRVEAFALEFLRHATIDAVYDKGRGFGELWISRLNGSLTSEICRLFEECSEWQQYQDMLLQAAEGQEAGMANAEAEALTEPKRRQSYLAEVNAWMVREHLGTVDEEAARLRIDVSALKSIRSSRGRLRCSQETLNRVLRTIGYNNA